MVHFFVRSGAATSSEGSCFSEGEDGMISGDLY